VLNVEILFAYNTIWLFNILLLV